MHLSRDEFSKNIIKMLYKYAHLADRGEEIDVSKCYLNFSKQEKEKIDVYKNIQELQTLPNEFAFVFEDERSKYLLASNRLNCKLESDDFEEIELSLAELAVIYLNKKLSIASGYNPTDVYNILFAYDDEAYEGHTFEELRDVFLPCSLYRINDDFILKDADIYCLFSYYLLHYAETSYERFEEKTFRALESVLFSSIEMPYFNIAFAINSNQWSHVFLESYRMIEHVFPAFSLRRIGEMGVDVPTGKMAKILENVIKWRPPEEQSIIDIFSEIEEKEQFQEILSEIQLLKKDKQEKNGIWYYKQVRNQIVHYRAVHKNVIFDNKQWNILIRFNISIIEYLYREYGKEILVQDVEDETQ